MSSVQESRGEKLIGVTHDPVLRPVGALMVAVGAIWMVFVGMAVQAGTLMQPVLALALMGVGAVVVQLGKPEIQI